MAELVLPLDRGEARGLVEHIEQTFRQCEKPLLLLDIARRLEAELGEARPYPRLPAIPFVR